MRIALLADYYWPYLESFHSSRREQLEALPFTRHQELLFADYFGSFISHRNHFRRIGHESELFVGNYYPLQQKWLRERGIPLTAAPETKADIVIRQLEEFRPDVFFMGSMFDYYGSFLEKVSRITRNIFAWIACPYPTGLDFSPIRCVLSSAPGYVEAFRKRGLKSEPLKAAFDSEVVRHLDGVEKTIDLSFVGGLSWGTHRFRMEALERLLGDGNPLQIWGYCHDGGWRGRWRRFWSHNRIASCYRGEVWGMSMYRTLAQSRVTLNMHVDVGRANNAGGNMRLYEATGCGALVISDFAPDVPEIFQPDREIVTYRTISELNEKVHYYRDHRAEAEGIARAGQRACWQRHGYERRIREFEGIIKRYAA